MIAEKPKYDTTECIYVDDCPLHAENLPFNAVTMAAFQEVRDIKNGKKKAELNRFHPEMTKAEMKEELKRILDL